MNAAFKQIQPPEQNNTDNNDDDGNTVCGVGKDILEYFDSLNWNVVNKAEYVACMENFIPAKHDLLSTSHALKLVDSKYVPYPEKVLNIPPETEGGDKDLVGFKYIPGVDPEAIPIYPTLSNLTQNEQTRLYYFYCRQLFKNRPFTELERLQFQNLRAKAETQFDVFQDFVKRQWIKYHCSRSMDILKDIETFLDKLWEANAARCLAIYPVTYKELKNTVALSLHNPHLGYSVMDFCKDICYRGTPLKMSKPKPNLRCDLITEFDKLSQIKPISMENESSGKPAVQPAPPVSNDMTVDYYLERENIDVVITNSGIKAIADKYANAKNDWVLPITVRRILMLDGKTSKKVVIIDKKLPPTHMSVHDKNIWHAKIVSRWPLIMKEHPNIFKKEEQLLIGESRSITQYDDNCFVEEFEEFGIDPSPKFKEEKSSKKRGKKSRSPVKKTLKSEKTDTEVEEGEILDTTEDEMPADGRLTSPGQQERPNRKRKISSSMTDHPYAASDAGFVLNSSKGRQAKSVHGIRDCQTYKLWKLHKSDSFNLAKQEQRSLNILVRSRVDGKLFHYDSNRPLRDEVRVSSKLEYQPEYGAAEMTTSELLREYLDLYLLRSAKLVRVRSIGHTKEVMLWEVKSLADIKEHLQVRSVATHRIFDPLYSVLTKLIDLPDGKYMLQHTAKMGLFAQLLVNSAEGANFNLDSYCSMLLPAAMSVPPTPIDPYTLTPLHHSQKTPPAVFGPAIDQSKCKFFKKPTVICKPKKKNSKGKKKKKSSMTTSQ